ncbi:MAG: hypothetical protein IJT91_01670 [Clostridia bacterium]|nr:hypothetical protein [Clostridia bacterium]
MNNEYYEKFNKDCGRLLIISRIYSAAALGSVMFSIGIIGLLIMELSGDTAVNTVPIWIFLILTDALSIILLCAIPRSIKKDFVGEKSEPYTFDLTYGSYDELCRRIDGRFGFEEENGCRFTYAKGKRNLKIFVYHFQFFDKKTFKITRKNCVESINKKHSFRNYGPMEEVAKNIHADVIMIDKPDEGLYAAARVNAEHGMSYVESRFTAFVDIENMKLYIPKYIGEDQREAFNYTYAAKVLIKGLI